MPTIEVLQQYFETTTAICYRAPMNRQERWRQRYKERRPEWDSSPILYRQLISEKVNSTTRILDIG